MSTYDLYTTPVDKGTWDVPSTGAARFSWEYDDGRQRLLDLYQRGKDKQWDATKRIDPLLAAVDAAFAPRREDALADVIDALVTTLTGHLAHEEREGLPLIGVALTAAEWRGTGFKIARRNGLSEGGKMFAWILDGADSDAAHGDAAHGDAIRSAAHSDPAATLRTLPPPLRLLYRTIWKPRFNRTPRW